MSEIITGVAVVSTQVAVGVVVAPVAAAGLCTSIGYALTKLPFWEDIEGTLPHSEVIPNGFCRIDDIQGGFCDQVERLYYRLLQMPSLDPNAQVATETLAGLAALRQNPLVASAAIEGHKKEISEVIDKLGQLPTLSAVEVQELNAKTTQVLERSLAESKRRLGQLIVSQFKAACLDTGWRIKDMATDSSGTALIAVNASGQSLAAYIDRSGAITTDVAGFVGRSCEQAMSDLYGALEKRGIRVEKKKEQPHYLFKGVSLIGGASKAEQIIKNALQHNAAKSSAKGNTAPRQSQTGDRIRAKKGHLLNRLRSPSL